MVRQWAVAAGLLVVLSSACASPRNDGKRPAEVKINEVKGTMKADRQEMSVDGLLIRRYDLNKDGKADMVKLFKVVGTNELLVRKEFDLNFDGRPDVWRFFDDKGGLRL